MFSETEEGGSDSAFLLSSPSSMQKLPNIKEERKKVKKKKTGEDFKRASGFLPDVIGAPQVRPKGNGHNEKRNVSALARLVVLII